MAGSPSPTRRRPPRLSDASTRNRLLEAAATEFAARGFEAATVRRVCSRAGANVAAVHYHFGSKDALYLATLRWAVTRCHAAETRDLLAFAERTDLTPEARFEGVVRHLARGMLGPQPEWHLRLLLRELVEPTSALDAMVREFMAPRFDALRASIAAFLPAADERTLSLHAMSVVGQLLYHRVAAPVALRLLGERGYDESLAEAVVAHVIAFSLAALRALGPEGAA